MTVTLDAEAVPPAQRADALTAAQGKRPWRTVRWREGGNGWLGAKVVGLAVLASWPPTARGGSAG